MSYDNRPMSTGAWFITLLVLAIPILNLVMYLIWAFGAGNRNRVTFCRASILWALIGVAIYAVLFSLGYSALADLTTNY